MDKCSFSVKYLKKNVPSNEIIDNMLYFEIIRLLTLKIFTKKYFILKLMLLFPAENKTACVWTR